MKTECVRAVGNARRLLRAAGPYVLIELVLPGGTLVALALWLHRNGHLRRFGVGGLLRTAGRLFDHLALAWQPPAGAPRRVRGGGPALPLLLPGR
ncbi:MAG: hypothetical protein U1F10_11925 [Burkholderiales bacterium]